MTLQWILTLSPLIALTVNVLVQIIYAHFIRRISTSIIAGLLLGFAVELLLLARIKMSLPLSAGETFTTCLLTYVALSFCFWAFLNLNMTSLRIRFTREIYLQDAGLTSQLILNRYSPEEMLKRRITRLAASNQITARDEKWILKSYKLLVFVFITNYLRKIIIPFKYR